MCVQYSDVQCTVTIWIWDKSGIQMVQTCLVVKWWFENRTKKSVLWYKISGMQTVRLITWSDHYKNQAKKCPKSQMFGFWVFCIQMVALLWQFSNLYVTSYDEPVWPVFQTFCHTEYREIVTGELFFRAYFSAHSSRTFLCRNCTQNVFRHPVRGVPCNVPEVRFSIERTGSCRRSRCGCKRNDRSPLASGSRSWERSTSPEQNIAECYKRNWKDLLILTFVTNTGSCIWYQFLSISY